MIGVLSLYYNKQYSFPDLTKILVDDAVLQKYVGVYSNATFPLKLTITSANGELTAQATGQSSFPLTTKNDKEFYFTPAGIKIIFKENLLTLKQGATENILNKE